MTTNKSLHKLNQPTSCSSRTWSSKWARKPAAKISCLKLPSDGTTFPRKKRTSTHNRVWRWSKHTMSGSQTIKGRLMRLRIKRRKTQRWEVSLTRLITYRCRKIHVFASQPSEAADQPRPWERHGHQRGTPADHEGDGVFRVRPCWGLRPGRQSVKTENSAGARYLDCCLDTR